MLFCVIFLNVNFYCTYSFQNDGVCRTGNGKTSKMVKGQMAPIFRQIGPKKKTPVLDEAVIERRQRFLMSGIPEKLKKQLEKTEAYMPMELLFPTIGHIQQKDVNTEESSLWNLQWPTCFVHLNLSEIDLPPIIHGNLHYGMLTKCQLELCSTTTRKVS